MDPKASTPTCILCGGQGASHEHVFGKWISRLMADGAPFALSKTPGRSGTGLKTINVKSRAPRATCNSGWMSRYEDQAKALLPPMIRGETVAWDCEQQAQVARWAFKTALMLDASSPAARVVPRPHFEFLYKQGAPPESVAIYIARYYPGPGQEHLGIIGSSYRPTLSRRDLFADPYQVTFSVGQGVFQLNGHSGGSRVEVHRTGQSPGGLVVPMGEMFEQLWPIRAEPLRWPPRGSHLDTPALEALARF